MRSLTVSDVMWSHIQPIRCGTPLTKVVKILLTHHVTGLPVVNDQLRVVGFVSEQDCIHALLVSNYHCEGEPVVDDVMFDAPLLVSGDTAMVDLAQRLGAGRPKVYPVVENDRLIGIITRTAILAQLAKSGCGIDMPRFASTE
ncbi:CBS domain-containing protein [Marinobacter sp. X15-166B]|uniref:CBS domain-containing protein n=1 Tax=Marinobacter sp. X15-166B TaxID=1897620 RepID=UPI00085CBEC9|nr:CBS domain-containing protein [Marinobacter sp. X15-166B]OEY66223.1 CBS domain-containing protein [Marinobacter sp. X15-166B]